MKVKPHTRGSPLTPPPHPVPGTVPRSPRLLQVKPHGIIGQSFDGDDVGVNGKLDPYSGAQPGPPLTTSAMAEGAIEGDAAEYKMASKFATEFKCATPAPCTTSQVGGQSTSPQGRQFSFPPQPQPLSSHVSEALSAQTHCRYSRFDRLSAPYRDVAALKGTKVKILAAQRSAGATNNLN